MKRSYIAWAGVTTLLIGGQVSGLFAQENPPAAKPVAPAAAAPATAPATPAAAAPAPAAPAAAPAPEAATPAAATTPATAPAAAAPAAAKDYTILKFAGQELKLSDVQETWKGLFPQGQAPDFATFDDTVKQNVLRGMMSERLLFTEATKAGTDKSPEVQKRLELLRKQVITQAFIENKSKSLVTDEQLKTAYNERAAQLKDKEEVHARHILVGSEAEAKAIAEQLKKGGDFEKIAKEKSTDKGSGQAGGDLGYFTKDKMVAEFADAAFKLKKGETSGPIKTAFGWHIIRLEDRRKVPVPTLDEMRDQLRSELSNQAIQSYVEGLLKASSIEYFGADGKKLPFSPTFEAPKQPAAAPAEAAPKAKEEAKPKK